MNSFHSIYETYCSTVLSGLLYKCVHNVRTEVLFEEYCDNHAPRLGYIYLNIPVVHTYA